jgi:hypothetical protein
MANSIAADASLKVLMALMFADEIATGWTGPAAVSSRQSATARIGPPRFAPIAAGFGSVVPKAHRALTDRHEIRIEIA